MSILRRRLSVLVGLAALVGLGYWIYATRDRTGEVMLVWEPVSTPPHPADIVDVYVRSHNPFKVKGYDLAIEDYKITRAPILRLYEIETHEAYAGADSSVMTVGQFGDTLYWRKTWAMLEKERAR